MRIFAALLCTSILFVALLSCSKKQNLVEVPPPPVPEGDIVFHEGVVLWRSSEPARGAVRYVYDDGDGVLNERFDHMAYPKALNRRDRALVIQHEVPILDLRPGQRLFYQVLNESDAGAAFSETRIHDVSTNGATELLTSTMIHIGFGDSHLVTFPNGKRLLIDAGWHDATNAVQQYLMQHQVNSIDAMLATHIHADHLGGIVESTSTSSDGLLNSHRPDVFFDSANKSTTSRSAYGDLLATLSRTGIARVELERGDTSQSIPELNLDPSVLITVLSSGTPPGYTPSPDPTGTDINNDSIVSRFTYGEVDFVIGGDAEDAAENAMVDDASLGPLQAEYYKAHHHGLSDASSSRWVSALRPRVVFIPNTDLVWEGDFLGAISEALTRFNNIHAHTYIVDEARPLDRLRVDGFQYNTTFATDGESFEVRVEIANQTAPTKPVDGQVPCADHEE